MADMKNGQTELVDIDSVTIDPSKSREERINDFLAQIHDPYCFLCRGIKVRISFTGTGGTLEEKLTEYFRENSSF